MTSPRRYLTRDLRPAQRSAPCGPRAGGFLATPRKTGRAPHLTRTDTGVSMTDDTSFEALEHGFLADFLEFYPSAGMRLGLHLYDGRAEDFSTPAIEAWGRTLGVWERRLAALDSDSLDVTPYLKREYAPLPERLRALTGYLEDIPNAMDTARRHLRQPLARPL